LQGALLASDVWEHEQNAECSRIHIPFATYSADNANEVVVQCAYCMRPQPPSADCCSACGQGSTRDAGFETNRLAYLTSPRRPCTHCGHLLPVLARMCPECRTRRSD
jgi:RNA polymerase subunit RPABC4/transcription elongation factor Spt4